MTEDRPKGQDETSGKQLDERERDAVEERKSGSSKVLHEVVREEGEEELRRSSLSLLFSGLAAGVSISFSLLAQGALKAKLPEAPWSDLVIDFGYTIGFLVVILGRLQLFTESTVTPVLPLATRPTFGNVLRLLRLWAIVLVANLLGTLLTMSLVAQQVIVPSEIARSMAEYARSLLEHDAWHTFLLGIPAGFLVASIAWILPNARGSEIWVVIAITYTVAISGFSHVVAGSSKAWLLWLTDQASLREVLGGLILPSLLGNIVGGTGLFTVLAHGQVRADLEDGA